MAFTYDSIVFNKIIIHDQPLEVSIKNSKDFINISKEIEGTWNNPKWFELPKVGVEKIYYKKDFLNHTFSEYYLWINEETQITFLYVHYFD